MAKENLPVILPGSIKKGRGFEETTDKNDYIIPRVKMLQALSPEVIEGTLKSGQVINSLTLDILPEIFIPIFKFTNWIRWNPRNKNDPNFDGNYAPGALIWKSNNPEDEKVKEEGAWGDNGEVPLATKYLNFFTIFPGHPMPLILSFSKTSYKAGKKLITLGSLFGGDMFGRKYKLKVKQEETDGNKYFVFDIEPVGIIEIGTAEFTSAENTYDSFSDKPIVMHEEAPVEGE